MAKKRLSREEREYQQAMATYQRITNQLLAGGEEETPIFTFETDKQKKVVNITSCDGCHCSISLIEFGWIKQYTGTPCLICNGELGIMLDERRNPAFYLICDRCNAVHRVVSCTLCLSDSPKSK